MFRYFPRRSFWPWLKGRGLHEADPHCGHFGPCGRRKNHPVRADPLSGPYHPPGRPGGPSGQLSGYQSSGKTAGYHHLLRPGALCLEGGPLVSGGHPGPRGFLPGNGALSPGAGRCRGGSQRRGRDTEPYGNHLAFAAAVSNSHLLLHQ